jgi:hypothetical protein
LYKIATDYWAMSLHEWSYAEKEECHAFWVLFHFSQW